MPLSTGQLDDAVREVIERDPVRIAEPPRIDALTLAGYIDHTLLKPEATEKQIRTLCAEAIRHQFAAVCVNPCWTSLCATLLAGSGVKTAAVIGFPLGATLPEVKAFEARRCLEAGALELDMVINIGALRSGSYDHVRMDISGVVETAHAGGGIVKAIIETSLLSDTQKVAACLLSALAHADFVKTSTGFGPAGATVADVALMRASVGPKVGVKASGGIRTYPDSLAMISAGATRIGTSAGVKILTEAGSKT